jgi:hypothetical protein
MAFHKDCPESTKDCRESPHAILDPQVRRFPADEALRGPIGKPAGLAIIPWSATVQCRTGNTGNSRHHPCRG